MIEVVTRYVLPAALALLPPAMDSVEARAMLLAIGLQESRFRFRRQTHGPALGFWQFEVAGVEAVLTHSRTDFAMAQALQLLSYDHTESAEVIHQALEHNDILAACFARCMLWAAAPPLPDQTQPVDGWALYINAWRPGKPHADVWAGNFGEAWARTLDRRRPPIARA